MRFLTMLAVMCFIAGAMPVSAQTTPVPSAAPISARPGTLKYCPLSTRVRDLDDTHTRYAVSLRALETGRASGTVALWAGSRRYDVPFRDVLALDSRDRISPETSFTVHFGAPTTLDGAVVTAIDEGGMMRPCDPWFAPWVPVGRAGTDYRTAEDRTTEERFLSRARAATAIDAPAAVADPTTCATPNQSARTVYAVTPDRPRFGGTGLSVVLVLVDPTDKVVDARIQTSSGHRQLDEVALSAARLSEFQGQVFRCRHIMGGYLFSVEFNP